MILKNITKQRVFSTNIENEENNNNKQNKEV
jgi:hypothetical protein